MEGAIPSSMAGAFAVSAAGLLLLSGADPDGTYLTDVLPGMLLAGLGLGVVLVAVAVAVLSGARDEESGMLSGLNTTGHEIGGSLGVAVLATIALAATGGAPAPGAAAEFASGISDAFVAAAGLAITASVVALVVLPSARVFLPRLRLAPSSMPIH